MRRFSSQIATPGVQDRSMLCADRKYWNNVGKHSGFYTAQAWAGPGFPGRVVREVALLAPLEPRPRFLHVRASQKASL